VEEEEEGGRQGGQRNTTRSGGFPSESYLAERERENVGFLQVLCSAVRVPGVYVYFASDYTRFLALMNPGEKITTYHIWPTGTDLGAKSTR